MLDVYEPAVAESKTALLSAWNERPYNYADFHFFLTKERVAMYVQPQLKPTASSFDELLQQIEATELSKP